MSGVQSLVPEHSIDGEVLDWSELLLLAKLVEHSGTDSCSMRPQDVLLGLLQLPVVLVTVTVGKFIK